MTFAEVLAAVCGASHHRKEAGVRSASAERSLRLRAAELVFPRAAPGIRKCRRAADFRHRLHRRRTASRCTSAISARSFAAPSTTSPPCWSRRAPLGRTSCAPPATFATSNATTRLSTKSGPPSIGSRNSTRVPASTGIQAILCRPELLVEIEAIAIFRNGTPREGVAMLQHGSRSLRSAWRRQRCCLLRVRAPVPAAPIRPGRPADRELRPYANTPDDLSPYGNFTDAVLPALPEAGGVQRRGARRRHPQAARRRRSAHRLPGSGRKSSR